MSEIARIERAVVSVFNKDGVEDLTRTLVERGVEIVSTGGTGRRLEQAGVAYTPVQEVTGVPEMLDGRVKTIHPKLLGGVLYRRDLPEHASAVEEHGLYAIDLVVVNLYPFSETIQRPGCTVEEAVEQIDIGGPTLIRSAAKNHAFVTVVVDPSDYPTLQSELAEHGGTTAGFRRRLCAKAFRHTSEYDAVIAGYFKSHTD